MVECVRGAICGFIDILIENIEYSYSIKMIR